MALKMRTFQGYLFQDDLVYKRAKREWEVIESIRKSTDLNNPRIALQIYNKAVSNNTFHTVIGYVFLKELRDGVVGKGVADEEGLKPITIYREDKGHLPPNAGDLKRYKLLYEQGETDKKKLKIVIGFLFVLIIGIFVITYKTQYSVFTYFKDYEKEIENRVIKEYSDWKTELEEKERELMGQ